MEGDVDYAEVSSSLGDLVVLDVRSRDEVVQDGQIPGTHCVPYKEFEEALTLDDPSFLKKYGFQLGQVRDQVVVTHCNRGGRAKKAAQVLVEKGYRARVYAGSFSDWKTKGGKVDPGKPFVPSN